MFKKLLKFVLIAAQAAGMTAAVSAAEADRAYYDFSTDEAVNMKISTGADKVEKDGRTGYYLNPKSEQSLYILCNVEDSVMYELRDYTPMMVTVEYYDEEQSDDTYGFFEVAYDGHRVPLVPNSTKTDRKNIWCDTEEVQLSGDGKWKTYSFYLENMRMANRLDGKNDIRIGAWCIGKGRSPKPITIGKISVRKIEPDTPLCITEISSTESGNIFGSASAVKLNLNVLNKSEKDVESKMNIYVFDEKENEIWNESKEIEIGANGELTVVTKPKIEKYGLYTIRIDTESAYTDNTSVKYTYSKSGEFSLAFKSGQNEDYGTALLISEYEWSERGKAAEIAADAGAAWAREEIRWSSVEKSKGNYSIPAEMWEDLKNNKAAGLKTELGLLYANSVYYDKDTFAITDAPTTAEEIEAYRNWCEWMARETKGYVYAFGVWNEYNIQNFNYYNETPEHYVEILKAAYEGVKAGNPDAIVIGMETAGIDLTFSEKAFKAGALNYMDVVGIHPYDWTPPFDTKSVIDNTKKLKQLMEKYGEEKPIWWTEYGFGNDRYTEEEQGVNMVLSYAVCKGYDLADKYFQFRLCDDLSYYETNVESGWGLIRDWQDYDRPSAAKQAYLKVSAMNKFIGKNAEVMEVNQYDSVHSVKFYNYTLGKEVIVFGKEKK